jgi:hypothetical protein
MSNEFKIEGQEALAIVNVILQSKKLNDLQSAIFLGAWAGYSYSKINKEVGGYEYDYIKQVGARLWQNLSQILGEPVSKCNIRSVLGRYQQRLSQSCQHSNCCCNPKFWAD